MLIPEIPAGADNVTAALLYAKHGGYVLPVDRKKRDGKHPGSVVGDDWQHQSSRDPEQIVAWFAGTDHNIALHAGRSGLVVVDVDDVTKAPAVLVKHLDGGPYQETRPDQPRRGHYPFMQPPGRTIGNGCGRLGSKWGDVRGLNGVIIVEPSDGGRYQWKRTGKIPTLPDDLGELLDDGKPGEDSATDEQVLAFIAENSTATRPGILAARVNGLASKLADDEGRHTSVIPFLTGALEEARAGYYSAQVAVDVFAPLFINAAQLGEKKRSPERAQAEFDSLLAWAVGQALAADLGEVRTRVEAALPDYEQILRNSVKDKPKVDPEAGKGPRVWRSDELTGSAPLEWLGVKHIPEAAVTLLTGDEGIGKSLVWVRITAAVTTGSALPEFGIPQREPRPVLVIVTEDDWASTVRPRLELAGADMDYVNVVCSEPDGSGSPYFPRDLDVVANAEPVPYLIVLDAWADTVEGHLSVKDPQQARQALHPWKELATKLRAAVLLLTHTNRATGGSIRERYAMTSELRKKARMALFAQQDEEGRLVVGPDKSNLVGKVAASVFTVEAVQVFDATDSSDGTVPRLLFVQGADFTAAELLTSLSGPPPSEGAQGFAAITLSSILQDNQPHDRAEVIEQLAKAGISESTAKRAADALGVVKDRKGFPATSTWQLPVRSTSEPSISADLTGLTGSDPELTGDGKAAAASQVTVSPVSSSQTDGPTVEPTGTVKQPENLCDRCGLVINPAFGPRHPFCES